MTWRPLLVVLGPHSSYNQLSRSPPSAGRQSHGARFCLAALMRDIFTHRPPDLSPPLSPMTWAEPLKQERRKGKTMQHTTSMYAHEYKLTNAAWPWCEVGRDLAACSWTRTLPHVGLLCDMVARGAARPPRHSFSFYIYTSALIKVWNNWVQPVSQDVKETNLETYFSEQLSEICRSSTSVASLNSVTYLWIFLYSSVEPF